MKNIIEFVFYAIISFCIYKYFKEARKPQIINEYKQNLGINDEYNNEKIEKLSRRLDIVSILAGVITFIGAISNSIVILIVLSIVMLFSVGSKR
ncbi:MAG: hypothetical protein ACRCXA_10090 [Peptostreptococcaceae bacterium]